MWESITGLSDAQLEELVSRCRDYFPERERPLGRKRSCDVATAVLITVSILRKNIAQKDLAELFNVSQSTVSRIFRIYVSLIKKVLSAEPWDVKEIGKGRIVLVDGTLIPTGNRAGHRVLYSGKRHQSGVNIQVLADHHGNLLHISKPTPGSMHDARSFYECGIDKLVPPDNTIGDLGYVGCGIITGHKRSKLYDLNDDQTRRNKWLSRIRSRVEHVIRRIKNWKILSTGYRGRLTDLPAIIKTITALEFFKTCY